MKKYCKWTYDDEHYVTECGEDFSFCDGDVEENGYVFCPGCGRKIKVVKE